MSLGTAPPAEQLTLQQLKTEPNSGERLALVVIATEYGTLGVIDVIVGLITCQQIIQHTELLFLKGKRNGGIFCGVKYFRAILI